MDKKANCEVGMNVSAYEVLVGKPRATLYDGEVETWKFDSSVHEVGSLKPGFLRSLDDVADAIQKIVTSDLEDIENFRRGDLFLRYSSRPNETFGERGYTDNNGTYLQRPLNKDEMRQLMKKVDSKLRPLFFNKVK